MTKRGSPTKPRRAKGPTLGRDRLAKISAVEGIALTPGAKQRAAEFERMSLSAEERRRSIIRAYSIASPMYEVYGMRSMPANAAPRPQHRER